MMSYQYKFQDDDQTKIKGSVKYVSADAAFVFLCFAYRWLVVVFVSGCICTFYQKNGSFKQVVHKSG